MKITDTRQLTIDRATAFIAELNETVYILGTNKYGENLAHWLISRGIKVGGFINDYTLENLYVDLPIVKSKNDFKADAIINCIVEGRTIDAKKNIEKCTPLKSIDYFALELTYFEELMPVDFLIETESILSDSDAYRSLFANLQDAVSKQHLEQIINFRLNRDISYLSNFIFLLKEQYFEDFVPLNMDDSFIDGGGFDGETTKEFIKRCPAYKKIYYFEPTENSYKKSKDSLSGMERINFFRKGLWDSTTTLKFDNTLSSANKISTNGQVVIETIALDQIIDEPIDYIKLDIEGAEYQAIKGAKDLIKKNKPKLAICVYHNQIDFLRIPELVLSYNKDYKVYLRHYTQGIFETVMYFV